MSAQSFLLVVVMLTAPEQFCLQSHKAMKKSITAFALLASVIITQSCMEEVETKQPQVAMSFTLDNHPPADLYGATLVMRVESSQGESVMEFQEVPFRFHENKFITSALDLPLGTYTITDFFLLNESDDIIYAVPKGSATLARTISDPLDYSFTITPSASRQEIDLHLVNTRNHKATDFGYVTLKRPGRRLTLSVAVKGSNKPASASALIMNGRDTVSLMSLAKKINHITIPVNPTEGQELIVTKEGYAPVRFLVSELLNSDEKKPLKVVLDPAFTIVSFIDFSVSATFDISLGGPAGTSLNFDWGDGTKEVYQLNGNTSIAHTYAEDGNHPITITGDIAKIDYFYSFYGQGMIDAISFQHLADLKEIRFGLTRGPDTIDLTHNTKLEFVMLSGLENMKALYLPEEHLINELLIEGPNGLTTAAVDRVISDLYENTAKRNITNGVLSLPARWYEWDEQFVGPPSAEAMSRLQSLKEDYGWTIIPDPSD